MSDRLLPVEDALELVLQNARALATEEVKLAASAGRLASKSTGPGFDPSIYPVAPGLIGATAYFAQPPVR